MHGHETVQLIAGGDINPARFIKLSTAADYAALQAGANDPIFGISANAARDAPLDGASALIASSGDSFEYIPVGNVCYLQIGTGGCTRGDELKSDTDGTGITRAVIGTTQQFVGAIALESAAAGELARVMVVRSSIYPALS